jgi:hypothetical protein
MSEEKKKYGAWLKATPKGEVINFTIEGKKYNMWKNTFKKPESNQPDYQIYEDNYKPKDDLEF